MVKRASMKDEGMKGALAARATVRMIQNRLSAWLTLQSTDESNWSLTGELSYAAASLLKYSTRSSNSVAGTVNKFIKKAPWP